MVGYDENFNCTLNELEFLHLRIILHRYMGASLRSLDRSDTCANDACGFDLENSQEQWLDDVLPCGGATEARNALHSYFGTIIENEKDIHIQPC